MPPLTVLAFLTVLGAAPSFAGSGPWVVGDGEYSVYMGTEAQRLGRLDIRDGAGGQDVVDVDQGISTLGAKAILSVGAQGRFEAELGVPLYRVYANRIDGPVCTTFGLQACATTQGIGVITLRGKGTLLDQLYGDPVTWAVGADARFGHFTAPTRARITNLSEGTLDIGAFTSIGTSGALGTGSWSGFVEVAGWYRSPTTKSYPAPGGAVMVAPHPEGQVISEFLIGWRPSFSFGPLIVGFARPGGLDFGEITLTDPDRFAALRVANLRIGGTILIRAKERLTFVVSGLHTVSAYNNPYTSLISFGVGTNGRLFRERG